MLFRSKGLDWQWVEGSHGTDAGCPGARRIPFVAGFAPAYQPCVYAPPADALDPNDPNAQPQGLGDAVRDGLRQIFGIDDPAKRVPEQPQPQQQPAQPPPSP